MTFRECTVKEVEAILVKFPKARRTPVMNFLTTMGNDPQGATINFGADAQSYRWDTHIQKAIRLGIDIAKGYKRVTEEGKIK